MDVKGEDECWSFVLLWNEVKMSPICLHQLLWDKQPKTKFILLLFLVHLRIEHFKYRLLVFFGNAHSCILDYKNNLLFIAIVIDVYEHMTFLGIVYGIENQIEYHLLHSLLITADIFGQNLVSVNLSNIV